MEDQDQTHMDANPKYMLPSPIVGKVCGTTEVIIIDTKCKRVGTFEDGPYFYKGKVRSGEDELAFTEATILAFQMYESDRISTLHHCLSLFKHPCIMNSLGYGYGSGEQEGYIFLAFPCFESTLGDFMDKRCGNTVDLERFTEDFIGLIRCVVFGLLELHSYGYYCPHLSGKQVIILKEKNSICAKLWDFCPLEIGNEIVKDMDWVRLGRVLSNTARNHNSYTPEIADLIDHMKQGTLKGIDILKHSAMLSIREKFDNILALNTFTLVHCGESSVSKENLHSSASSDKDKAIADFKILLDRDVGWVQDIPLWIVKRMRKLGFLVPVLNTFREFLWRMRCLIEHENSYVPPEAAKIISAWEYQYSNVQPDLKYELRRSWPHLFLISQKFATSLQLKNP